MGLISKWREFSEWLYDKFGKKLQSSADKVKALETPQWLLDYEEELLEKLGDEVKQKLMDFVLAFYSKFNEKYAKQITDSILKKLK